tara:strand:+ start:465 stop:986 length:522 start_codon:yes stop_codon:yes gene_type:complete
MADDNHRRNLENYYRDISVHVEPMYARAAVSLGHAVSYAQIGLKWAFLLNGGALVALPPLSQITEKISSSDIRVGAIWFVIGIICAGVCSVVSYWNFIKHNGFLTSCGERELWTVLIQNFPDKYGKLEENENYIKAKNNIEKASSHIKWSFPVGILFGIASYFMFFFGSMKLV